MRGNSTKILDDSADSVSGEGEMVGCDQAKRVCIAHGGWFANGPTATAEVSIAVVSNAAVAGQGGAQVRDILLPPTWVRALSVTCSTEILRDASPGISTPCRHE